MGFEQVHKTPTIESAHPSWEGAYRALLVVSADPEAKVEKLPIIANDPKAIIHSALAWKEILAKLSANVRCVVSVKDVDWRFVPAEVAIVFHLDSLSPLAAEASFRAAFQQAKARRSKIVASADELAIALRDVEERG